MRLVVPELVRRRAEAAGATDWVERAPELLEELARDWELELGEAYEHGTAGVAVRAVRADGTPAVLKVRMPVDELGSAHEATVLRLAGGRGCAALLELDESRGAMLLERLGPALADLGLPLERRHEVLCETGRRLWRPVPEDAGLPTGAWKARWLAEHVARWWEELDRPCPERVVEHALRVADRREAAHDDERAVLVHGDLHQWNALQDTGSPGTFKLVDPDGLRADPEYDLGIVMREDPEQLLTGDPAARARRLAALTGLDPVRIWEWGVLERVSTGLLGVRDTLQPWADQMLVVADRIVADGAAP